MKVVFPCPGSLVLLKQDLDTLQAFYNATLMTSKMNDFYKTSNSIVQVGSLNYIPPKFTIALHKPNLLTIEKMRGILGLEQPAPTPTVQAPAQPTNEPEKVENEKAKPISDNDLLSNPFFQTLRPL